MCNVVYIRTYVFSAKTCKCDAKGTSHTRSSPEQIGVKYTYQNIA